MPDNPDAKKEENSQSSKNIEIPPIPKQTAGAVVGAAAGSIAGPIGAVVGGVGLCCRKSRRKATSDCSSCKADRSQRHEKFQSDLESTPQTTPEQKIRCQTTQSSWALARQDEKDRIEPIDNNKITQTIGNSGTVEIVGGCSETLCQSQQTALAARSESD